MRLFIIAAFMSVIYAGSALAQAAASGGGANGNTGNLCEIVGPGAAMSYAPLLLILPALIIARRLWRRNTN